MIIYVPDFDNNIILEILFNCVANLHQLERDLDDIYPDGWYYDKQDAEEQLLCLE